MTSFLTPQHSIPLYCISPLFTWLYKLHPTPTLTLSSFYFALQNSSTLNLVKVPNLDKVFPTLHSPIHSKTQYLQNVHTKKERVPTKPINYTAFDSLPKRRPLIKLTGSLRGVRNEQQSNLLSTLYTILLLPHSQHPNIQSMYLDSLHFYLTPQISPTLNLVKVPNLDKVFRALPSPIHPTPNTNTL